MSWVHTLALVTMLGLAAGASAQHDLCVPASGAPEAGACTLALRLALEPQSARTFLSLTPLSIDLGLLSGEASEVIARLAEAHDAEDVRGVQVGAVNWARDVRGLQIGGLNIARRLRGAQIGGALISYESPSPFYLGLRIGWYGRSSS